MSFHELHKLAAAIAPELPPLRIADISQWAGVDLLGGCTGSGLITLNSAAIRAAVLEDGYGVAAVPALMHQVFLHELGHRLENPLREGDTGIPVSDLPASAAVADFQAQALCGTLAMNQPDPPGQLPWGDAQLHGWRFIRRALHLRHRASLHGVQIPLTGYLCAGFAYGLSGAVSYAAALGGEPRRLVACTFGEIESIKPPRDFLTLWNEDTGGDA